MKKYLRLNIIVLSLFFLTIFSGPFCAVDNFSLNLRNDAEDDYYYSVFTEIIEKKCSPEIIATLLKNEPKNKDIESVIKALIPAIRDKEIKNTKITDEEVFRAFLAENNIELVVNISKFPSHKIDYSFNWNDDPFSNRNWQLHFQNLFWLRPYINDDPAMLDITGYYIFDWFKRELFSEESLEFTWNPYSTGQRLNLVSDFLHHYIENNEVLDLKIMEAAIKIIVTHLYILSSNKLYPRIFPHNHGIHVDLSLLRNLSFYDSLKDKSSMEGLADMRLQDQFKYSFTPEGVHIENSPGYYFSVIYLLDKSLINYNKLQRKPPKSLLKIMEKAVGSFIYFIQPNLTFPQFGDTPNKKFLMLKRFLKNTDFKLKDQDYYDEYLFTFSSGIDGAIPSKTDKVFPVGGYASFRDRWHDAETYADMITGHFSCSNLSRVHYHKDEFTFSLYGYGTEIIIDGGFYSHNYDDSLTIYQYSAFAHNVLIIDGKDYTGNFDGKGNGEKSKILDFNISDDSSWVMGTHSHYKSLGIKEQYRTFIHSKPNIFLVVDEIKSSGGQYKYEQLFHFHPDFTQIEKVDNETFFITSKKPGKPGFLMKSFKSPDNVIIKRGILNDDEVQGWYFPKFNAKEKCNVLIFIYSKTENDVVLPVFMSIIPPGENFSKVNEMSFISFGDSYELGWREGDISRRIEISFDR